MSLTSDIKRLSEENTPQVIADSLSLWDMNMCYTIYVNANWYEPDSIIEAIEFIINH